LRKEKEGTKQQWIREKKKHLSPWEFQYLFFAITYDAGSLEGGASPAPDF
jgi:hypothetical protein